MFHGNIPLDTATGLKELRKRIDAAKIPSSKIDETLNIATWNVREFGKAKRRNASLHFIAEILGQFDLISIVELQRNLDELKTVLSFLGSTWRVVYSDYIADGAGDFERMAYVYDERAVQFVGLASEADPPRKKNPKTKKYEAAVTWWRSPYMASFQSGNFDFIILCVHIRWGATAEDRIEELQALADWVDERIRDQYGDDKDIIVMGDFNIPAHDDKLSKAITSSGLQIPTAVRGLEHGSNLAKNKRYDQILHYPSTTNVFTNKAGVLDFYAGGIAGLYPKDPPSKDKFTYEMSDHLPLWVQIHTDTDGEELDQLLSKKKK